MPSSRAKTAAMLRKKRLRPGTKVLGTVSSGPNVTNNHQEKNAHVLSDRNAAILVLEQDCTPEKIYSEIRDLMSDEDRRKELSRKLHELVRVDSTERIAQIVEELIKK